MAQAVETYEEKRLREVVGEIRTLERQLTENETKRRRFCSEHTVVGPNGFPVLQSADLNAAPALEAEWLQLQRERDDLQARWNRILAEYATLKKR